MDQPAHHRDSDGRPADDPRRETRPAEAAITLTHTRTGTPCPAPAEYCEECTLDLILFGDNLWTVHRAPSQAQAQA
jgi:hypothetical protein